jgi:eukaryotic-like serine/threonine-protein kinase
MPVFSGVLNFDDSLTILEQIDETADRFEAAWKNGGQPNIADFLGLVRPEGRRRLLRELIGLDQACRTLRGLDQPSSDYRRQFPNLHSDTEDNVGKRNRDTQAPTVLLPRTDEYEILAELGCGGMGVVYKARQRRPDRLVAIKVLRGGVAPNSREASRLLAEAESVAQLQHPNIVQIYEVGQRDGFPFFSMELAEGGTLASQLGGQPQAAVDIATMVETIARAVHFSHQRGVIHRDLKPANVLLTRDGIPKITDFGLAKRLEAPQGQTQTGAILGTPAYIAPEQAGGNSNELTPAVDTYALGVILYEMLTGAPPFKGATALDTLEQVRMCEPVAPSRLTPKVPRDLETICLKAMNKDPARRYASAMALADDLGRFQRGEPIQARPLGPLVRSARWCRRKPAWAALVVTAVLLILAVIGGAVSVALVKTAREQDHQREAIVQRLQLLRVGNHADGWSVQAWDLVVDARRIRGDDVLRDQAAALCEGLDAHLDRHIENEGVSWIAFDATGSRLMAGGRTDSQGRAVEGAKLWDGLGGSPLIFAHAGAGPVAFRRDGAPLVLLPDAGALKLWEINGAQALSEFQLTPAPGVPTAQLALNAAGMPLLAMDAAATVVAAGTEDPHEKGRVLVWETRSGRLLFQTPTRASSLTVSSSGALLAAVQSGRILVWSVENGKQVADLPLPRVTPQSLAFSPDERRLAVGDSSGAVMIWDLALAQPVAFCYGPFQGLYALAFSSDGTILAGGGRGPTILWNAASGQVLLRLRSEGLVTHMAFSADAERLAVSSSAPGSISLWQLEHGRGIRTLRGLASPASKLCFSADGARLAALACNRKAAIWDADKGRLLRLLDAPVGGPEAEAALALSSDGSRFACSAGAGARLWDVDSGNERGDWQLPVGVGGALAFHPSGELASFRAEAARSGPRPVGGLQSLDGPWICRLRNLTGLRPLEPIQEFSAFSCRFFRAVASPDGSSFVAEGTCVLPSGPVRAIKCFDSANGSERWSFASARTALVSELVLDSAGASVAVRADNRPAGKLLDVSTGEQRETLEPFPIAMSAGGVYWIAAISQKGPERSRGFAVYRRSEKAPFVTLGIDRAAVAPPIFSPDGKRLAWPNEDGTVSICDLEELRRKLAQAKLAW